MLTATAPPIIRWSVLRVMISSGDVAWLRDVSAALTVLGVRYVEEEPTPINALASLARNTADVLLLSDEHPMETIDLIHRLRQPKLTPCPFIQIILFTKNLNENKVGAWIKLGVDYVCGRGAPATTVVSQLKRLMARPASKIALPAYIGPDRRRAPRTAYNGPNRRRSKLPRR